MNSVVEMALAENWVDLNKFSDERIQQIIRAKIDDAKIGVLADINGISYPEMKTKMGKE